MACFDKTALVLHVQQTNNVLPTIDYSTTAVNIRMDVKIRPNNKLRFFFSDIRYINEIFIIITRKIEHRNKTEVLFLIRCFGVFSCVQFLLTRQQAPTTNSDIAIKFKIVLDIISQPKVVLHFSDFFCFLYILAHKYHFYCNCM